MERLLNRFFFIVLPILLGITIGLTFYTMQQNQKVLEQVKHLSEDNKSLSEQNKRLAEETNNNIEDVRTTLLCMGEFFNREDRANLKIVTYKPCVIENTLTGEEETINFAAEGSASSSPEGSGQASDADTSGSSSNNNTPGNGPPSDISPPGQDVRPPKSFLDRIGDGVISFFDGVSGLIP